MRISVIFFYCRGENGCWFFFLNVIIVSVCCFSFSYNSVVFFMAISLAQTIIIFRTLAVQIIKCDFWLRDMLEFSFLLVIILRWNWLYTVLRGMMWIYFLKSTNKWKTICVWDMRMRVTLGCTPPIPSGFHWIVYGVSRNKFGLKNCIKKLITNILIYWMICQNLDRNYNFR